jgi:hypothetical protein
MHQPHRLSIVAIIVIGFALSGVNALADLGLRCGTRLITPGDHSARVLKECGEPDYVDSWVEERIYRYPNPYPGGSGDRERYGPVDGVIVHITVEEWTYDHGPHRFIDRVRIENGRVRKISSGSYGH